MVRGPRGVAANWVRVPTASFLCLPLDKSNYLVVVARCSKVISGEWDRQVDGNRGREPEQFYGPNVTSTCG